VLAEPSEELDLERMTLIREPLDGCCDPLAAARWLRGEPRAVALSGAWCGGGTILSSFPVVVAAETEDPFAVLDHLPRIEGPRDAHVGGGWFGWFGFGLAASVEELLPAPRRGERLPFFDLAFHDHVVVCDAEGRWWFEALWTSARSRFLRERLCVWRERLNCDPPPARPFHAGPLRPVGTGLAGHRLAVADTVDRIAAGELSQANICLRFEAQCEGDPLDLWMRAMAASAPAYGAYVAPGRRGQSVVSLSPELFLRRHGREVITRPIKGTASADADPRTLAASEKDRAENVMIVDLMRNDLGRVCDYGSITVQGLCEIRRGPGVWHLESSVSGRLRPEVHDGGLLRATFPPGSVTGAPKVHAIDTIHQLEATAREVYCGAIGVCSPVGGLELSVAIRTFETADGLLWLGVGGGIVSDSIPDQEIEEVRHKAQGVAAAAGLRLAVADVGRTMPGPVARAPRPDPRSGIFETINVIRGDAISLVQHLERLETSCAHLGLELPRDLGSQLTDSATTLVEGGLRVTGGPDGWAIVPRHRPAGRTPTRLTPVVVPGGLGSHKWIDRRLIDLHSGQGATPLVCDIDGTVLEAGYAAVMLITGNRLTLPPLDGRQLPSISRRRLLEAVADGGWEIEVESFSLADTAAAEAIILTSSLRGPHLGTLPGATPARLAGSVLERLREAWAQTLSRDLEHARAG
jgi:para-aminobenzoate synthetase/4-amino-4-deoxychorismate lyase